jgi:uncharacterized iron-regulated membrane protein
MWQPNVRGGSDMTSQETIARNLIRFFILIVFEAGVFSGIGATLLLGDTFIKALVVTLALITAVACGWIMWKQKTQFIGKEVVEGAAQSIAKIFIIIVFVAGIILGVAAVLLTGISAGFC